MSDLLLLESGDNAQLESASNLLLETVEVVHVAPSLPPFSVRIETLKTGSYNL